MLHYIILVIMASESGTPRGNMSGESQTMLSSEQPSFISTTPSISPVVSETPTEADPYQEGLRLLKDGQNDAAIKSLYDAVMDSENLEAAQIIISTALSLRSDLKHKDSAYEAAIYSCFLVIEKTDDSNTKNTLGFMYEHGRVPLEEQRGPEYLKEQAKYWYTAARNAGVKLGQENLDRLEQETTA